MNLRGRIPKTPARQILLLLGGLFSLSCLSLLSEGTGHLRVFLPLATANLLVGALASERVARLALLVEGVLILGALGYQFLRLHAQSPS